MCPTFLQYKVFTPHDIYFMTQCENKISGSVVQWLKRILLIFELFKKINGEYFVKTCVSV